MELTKAQIKSEIHDVTRQCFTRHKFETWGDALKWLREEDYDILQQEAGSLGRSKLSTEIQWLISLFGPTEKVDWDIVRIQKVPPLEKTPATPDTDPASLTEPVKNTQTAPRRKPRRKRY